MKFVRATSRNLPFVDFNMFLEYLAQNNCLCGIQKHYGKHKPFNVYGDNSVGWVQLKRRGEFCVVKAKVCPQLPTNRRYTVRVCINENTRAVTEASCSNCIRSPAGCQHIAVLLKWLNRRTEDPRSPAVTVYCTKPRVARVRKVNSAIQTENKGAIDDGLPGLIDRFQRNVTINNNHDILEKLSKPPGATKAKNSPIIERPVSVPVPIKNLKKYSMSALLETCKGNKNAELFLKHITNCLSRDICSMVEEETRSQSGSPIWHELRKGRITASVIFEVVNSKKTPGIALEKILGTSNDVCTKAMKRGKTLEDEVLRVVAKHQDIEIHKSGLILRQDYPAFGASPDGIGENFVVEIKCPTNASTVANYYDKGKIKNRCRSQIQWQMFIADKSMCYFVIANPDFEVNHQVLIVKDTFDIHYVKDMIDKALIYWKTYVFPKLLV